MQVEHSMWATWPDRVSETEFRREGDFLAQLGGGATVEHYRNTVQHIRHAVEFDFSELREDDAFGVVQVDVDGKLVSRDLLDSILEIDFLIDHLGFSQEDEISVLDIGAGYGRFAHRFTQIFPNAFVYCADAVEKSSRICESYLRYRGVDRAMVVTMDDIETLADRIDLAVNIHSWSECTLGAINAWLAILAEKQVRNLFLVPHSVHCATIERDGSQCCFLPAILHSGLNLTYSRPKYPRGVDGLYPTQYYLFEREMD